MVVAEDNQQETVITQIVSSSSACVPRSNYKRIATRNRLRFGGACFLTVAEAPYNGAMHFPVTRLRRLRRTEAMRSLVRETYLQPSQLIYPLFLCPGEGVRKPIGSMPGVFNLSIDEAVKEAAACARLGIGGLLLFGLPEAKDASGSGAYADDGIVQRGLRALKADAALKSLVMIADTCLCEYTSHGHCGPLAGEGADCTVDNDATLPLLAKTAVSQAQAGADIVAPSDMMDGRVGAIREALDEAGFAETPILSYAAKFASAFYGPFREGRRFHTADGRPSRLPDGLGESARSDARD